MAPNSNLLLGESPLENAPNIQLKNGENCIPQHYLQFNHTLESVERIVAETHYNDRYPVFVCEDITGIYIQVGIIGYDNYTPIKQQKRHKIVYGRKWRVEPELPSSEIIQSVFLAIKKAREHEIRELFCLWNNGKKSTPFNNHHDLPLMAQNADLFEYKGRANQQNFGKKDIRRILNNIRYDSAHLALKNLQRLGNDEYLVEVEINRSTDSQLPELNKSSIHFILPTLNENNLYFELMATFLKLSDQHVEDTFSYQSFNRFSRQNSILAIGELSTQLRPKNKTCGFIRTLELNNYKTDKNRVPNLGRGINSQKLRSQLSRFGVLAGQLPVD